MSFPELISRMKISAKDAESIFDRSEPIGTPTDLVMARRRWFGRVAKVGKLRPEGGTAPCEESARDITVQTPQQISSLAS